MYHIFNILSENMFSTWEFLCRGKNNKFSINRNYLYRYCTQYITYQEFSHCTVLTVIWNESTTVLYCNNNYDFIVMLTSMLYEYVRHSFTIITRCLKPSHTRISMCVFVHDDQCLLIYVSWTYQKLSTTHLMAKQALKNPIL